MKKKTCTIRIDNINLNFILLSCSLSTGAFQKLHGDAEGELSQSTVCRVISAVSVALAKRRQEYITFPHTAEQIKDTQQQFFAYGNFPGIIGAIDCTHVPIQSPGGPNARFFINRKCRSSINTQVCKTKSAMDYS